MGEPGETSDRVWYLYGAQGNEGPYDAGVGAPRRDPEIPSATPEPGIRIPEIPSSDVASGEIQAEVSDAKAFRWADGRWIFQARFRSPGPLARIIHNRQ